MSSFRFKQFEIFQDRCAMKVGTDGVLVGAWARGGSRILDIGSGTGLISLMMAQRYQDARVVGIDMDEDACRQACENVASSPFADRVEIVHSRLQDFLPEEKFDAIVSNPPFFVDTLPFRELWQGIKRLLLDDGVFSVVLPVDVEEQFIAEGCMSGFYLVGRCAIKTVERKSPKRVLLSFERHRRNEMENVVETMMDADGNRSEWYAKLTDKFYL